MCFSIETEKKVRGNKFHLRLHRIILRSSIHPFISKGYTNHNLLFKNQKVVFIDHCFHKLQNSRFLKTWITFSMFLSQQCLVKRTTFPTETAVKSLEEPWAETHAHRSTFHEATSTLPTQVTRISLLSAIFRVMLTSYPVPLCYPGTSPVCLVSTPSWLVSHNLHQTQQYSRVSTGFTQIMNQIHKNVKERFSNWLA